MLKALAASALVAVLLAGGGAAALHRYDASRAEQIAEGVTVAGVDVGGLTLPEARAAVSEPVRRLLEEPLTLTHRGREFVVEPGLVDVETNAEALLRRALARSQEGNFLTRAYRDLTGQGLETDLALRVEYSDEAADRVVAGIRRALDRPVREAKSSVSFAGVRITPSQEGVAVRARALRKAIDESLTEPGAPRTVAVPTKRLRPKVTTKELENRFSHVVAVSRSRMELRLFVRGKLAKSYRVGIGRSGFETPTGLYEIESKAANPAWWVPDKPWAGDLAGKVIPAGDPRNPIKARWMGFWEGSGIHGTADEASIGTAASHGCVRMVVRDVVDLYDRVPLHAPIYIG